MLQICDMRQIALLPLRRKACRGIFRLKNPMASAGFEPVILGTRGQHANHQTTEAALIVLVLMVLFLLIIGGFFFFYFFHYIF
jgi:hypothetical protein